MKPEKILKALKALQKQCEKQELCDEKCKYYDICPGADEMHAEYPEFWGYLKRIENNDK